jgi:K+-transporting ATPase ATPase B chain
MTTQAKATAMTDRKILRHAIVDSFRKLDPRLMVKNPVMFVVEVGAVITLVVLVGDIVRNTGGYWFGLQITVWLWFTVLFANFAEAMAEGRGKAQAETLRRARGDRGTEVACGWKDRSGGKFEAALRGHRARCGG